MDDDGFRTSLWQATAPPAPATGALEGEQRVDVAVIGAGYTGLSCALALAEGGARVAVLEAGEIGQGASGRNNGQVIPTLSRVEPDELAGRAGEGFVQLVCDSARLTFELIARYAMQCEAVQNGWVQPAHTPGRMRLAEARAAAWGRRGAPVEVLDRAGVGRVTGSSFWHGGWLNQTGGKLNALAYCRELARAAIGSGARVHTRSAAQRLERADGLWRVATALGGLRAERVVIATHAYSGALWPGLAQSVFPVTSYQMATAPLAEEARRSVLPFDHACSDTHGDLHFFRWDAFGRLVTGGALVLPWRWRARLARRIGERVARVFPQLGVPRFEFQWHGRLGITLDRMPHVHELAPGVLAWLGCNGRGLALATAIGRELARACLGAPLASLRLPMTRLRPIPGHALAHGKETLALLYYRYRDSREMPRI
jgi:glycine/D-amino acid oxidase-like deaminating enzyme